MPIERYNPTKSRNTLLLMLITALLLGAVVAFNMPFLRDVYFSEQLTRTGIFINGLILLMFTVGVGKVIANLLFYRRQEIAIGRFIDNDNNNPDMALANVDEDSLMFKRYETMRNMQQINAPIDHGALAAILVAAESARSSLPKFVNNVLILTGVFGTIVSLSIALFGASDLLQTSNSLSGMNLVVHGMSTALSTTITAIVCFMFFGYFHIRTGDIQTHVVSELEQVSVERLMPRFSASQESLIGELAGLILTLRDVSDSLSTARSPTVSGTDKQLISSVNQQSEQLHAMNQQLQEVLQTLRAGFRLDH